ncbi:MAG: transcription antitermination factor NusB [Pseudomonadota bacterium]
MADTGVAARAKAAWLLDQVIGEGRLMVELQAAGALDDMPPEDRARATRLAQDTLRGLERADRLLQKHLKKYPPLHVRNVLRLGTVELCSGAAAHGVVNACVSIVASHRKLSHLKGLVNAVLRKIAALPPQAWSALRAPRLPNWLRAPLVKAWGATEVAAIETAHFHGAPLDLTAKTEAAAVLKQVGGKLLPTGSVRLMTPGQVSQLAGYASGDWWVQDAASALPVRLLDPKPGERVVDLCAAPGGKTLQLAACGAKVTAVDSSGGRMRRVSENLARCGLDAKLLVADALSVKGAYDAVLLDAPCSATGTIRRHPDLPHAKDGAEFAGLIEQQSRFIDHGWSLVKPGGRMVFCTCSLLPDEGEVQIEDALRRHRDMRVAPEDLNGIALAWLSSEGGLRLRPDFWPDTGGMDGFYMALLRKTG